MSRTRVGLVGCGRIGRNLVRILDRRSDLEIAAIQDRAEPEQLEYLLKFDTLLGRFPEPIRLEGDALVIGGRRIALLPSDDGAPDWRALGVDVVVLAVGRRAARSEAEAHLAHGAARVLLCTPLVEPPDVTIVVGVNDRALHAEHRIVSAGSVTANCAAPVLATLDAAFGLERVFLTAVHAYSNQLRLADVPADDMRTGRAAAENIIPQPTGAGELIGELIPGLAGRISALSMNVPVPNGSVVDLVCWHRDAVTSDGINAAVKRAAEGDLYGIIDYETEPIVSSDVIRTTGSGTFDSLSTMVLDGQVSKTLTFYDNGWGYSHRVVDLMRRLATFAGEEARR